MFGRNVLHRLSVHIDSRLTAKVSDIGEPGPTVRNVQDRANRTRYVGCPMMQQPIVEEEAVAAFNVRKLGTVRLDTAMRAGEDPGGTRRRCKIDQGSHHG